MQLVVEQQVTAPWRASGSVNVFRNQIDAFETILLFPRQRPFALGASTVGTWDATLNNRFQMPRSGELNLTYVYCAARNVPQGRQLSRSSLDVAAKWPVLNERAELLFTFTDIFNGFVIQQDIDGQGFRALYQNLLESQVATVGLRVRF